MRPVSKAKSGDSVAAAHCLANVTIWPLLVLSMVVIGCSGYDPTATAPAAASAEASQIDPLEDVLRLAKTGDTGAAVPRFVDNAPDNWLEATSLEEFRISETDFAALNRNERNRLQQQFIVRVGEIKDLARAVIDRAKEAKSRSDDDTAQRYLDAVHRFGTQLRDSDTVTVFQACGSGLAQSSLSE